MQGGFQTWGSTGSFRLVERRQIIGVPGLHGKDKLRGSQMPRTLPDASPKLPEHIFLLLKKEEF